MRVYADLFFLLNAGADYALLLAAGRLAGIASSGWRLLAAAAFGGGYALAALLLPVPAAFSWPGVAAAGALMVTAAYAPCSVRALLRLLGFLYGSGAAAAGLALVIAGGADGVGWGQAGVPWWGIVLALGGTLAGAAAVYDRRRVMPSGRWISTLEVEIGGRSATCRALLDSGNRLADPCGDGPAIVVPAEFLSGLIPTPLLQALRAGPASLAAALDAPTVPPHWTRRFRFVPYRVVGRDNGILPAVRPDAVWLGDGTTRRPVRAVLAVSPTRLGAEREFAALVPAALMTTDGAERPVAGRAGVFSNLEGGATK